MLPAIYNGGCSGDVKNMKTWNLLSIYYLSVSQMEVPCGYMGFGQPGHLFPTVSPFFISS